MKLFIILFHLGARVDLRTEENMGLMQRSASLHARMDSRIQCLNTSKASLQQVLLSRLALSLHQAPALFCAQVSASNQEGETTICVPCAVLMRQKYTDMRLVF